MTPADNDASKPVPPEPLFEVWKQYESIAMHFNELIARFRLQALGGTATIATIAVLYTSNKASEWVFVGVLAFLSVAWTALWQLDYGYYQRLLSGTVGAVTDLEKKMNAVKLSTRIEDAFRFRFHGHFWFYLLVQFALLTSLALSTFHPWVNQGFGVCWFSIIPAAFALWLVVMAFVSWPPRQAEKNPPALLQEK